MGGGWSSKVKAGKRAQRKTQHWWDKVSDFTLRAFGVSDPRAARIHANRSEGSRRAWETRKANAAAKANEEVPS